MSLSYSLSDLELMIREAKAAAAEAANKYYMEELKGEDYYPCGFAWISLKGVKGSTKLGKLLLSAGFKKSYGGGMSIWNPSELLIQNMDAKFAGAKAAANVFRKYGLEVYPECRMD